MAELPQFFADSWPDGGGSPAGLERGVLDLAALGLVELRRRPEVGPARVRGRAARSSCDRVVARRAREVVAVAGYGLRPTSRPRPARARRWTTAAGRRSSSWSPSTGCGGCWPGRSPTGRSRSTDGQAAEVDEGHRLAVGVCLRLDRDAAGAGRGPGSGRAVRFRVLKGVGSALHAVRRPGRAALRRRRPAGRRRRLRPGRGRRERRSAASATHPIPSRGTWPGSARAPPSTSTGSWEVDLHRTLALGPFGSGRRPARPVRRAAGRAGGGRSSGAGPGPGHGAARGVVPRCAAGRQPPPGAVARRGRAAAAGPGRPGPMRGPGGRVAGVGGAGGRRRRRPPRCSTCPRWSPLQRWAASYRADPH